MPEGAPPDLEPYRTLARNFPRGAVVLFDREMRYLVADGELISSSPYAQTSFEGRRPADIFPPEILAGFVPLVERSLAGEECTNEYSVNGYWLRHLTRPVRDESGAIVGAMVIAQDITEQKRAEDLNRRLVDAVPGGLVQVARDGAIIHANEIAQRFLDLTYDEITRRYVAEWNGDTIHEDGRPFPADDYPVSRCLATGEPDGPRTIGVRRRDDSVAWGVFTALPMRDLTSGAADGAVVAFLDITERKQLEDQLRHSQKMEAIGKLAGGVAHDFNNLLTVILGRSELLLERLPEGDRTRDDIKLFHRTAQRAAGLTRQLLAISRQQVSHARVVDLNHMVSHMAELLNGLIGEHIELRTTLEVRLGRVQADPAHLEQVILNLCVNARDAMPDGGVLTIQTANAEVRQATTDLAPGRYALLAVKDTGHGIDPRIQSRIFEPFFTTKADGKGTGLGLSTVFGIVRQHGGAVTVRSDPGKGTTFLVYLPRCDLPPGDASGSHLAVGPSATGTETVLLVEDHDDLRQMLGGLLEARGYKLLIARHGAEALALSEAHAGEIHLLITDMVMPGMNGRELGRRLSASRRTMKVLYVSGYSEEPVTVEDGAAFLQKPFTSEALSRAVRELLDESGKEDRQ